MLLDANYHLSSDEFISGAKRHKKNASSHFLMDVICSPFFFIQLFILFKIKKFFVLMTTLFHSDEFASSACLFPIGQLDYDNFLSYEAPLTSSLAPRRLYNNSTKRNRNGSDQVNEQTSSSHHYAAKSRIKRPGNISDTISIYYHAVWAIAPFHPFVESKLPRPETFHCHSYWVQLMISTYRRCGRIQWWWRHLLTSSAK